MSRNAQIVLTTLCIGLLAFLSPALADPSGTGSVETDPAAFPAGETTALRLEVDGVARRALVYRPEATAGDTGSGRMPVLLALHGYGSRAEDFSRWVDLRALADRNGFVLIYPEGLPIAGVADSFHWNPAPASENNKSSSDDLGFIDALLDRLDGPLRLDPARTYAVGYSNGGMMAYALACYRAARFAAVGIHAGTMLADTAATCRPEGRTRLAVFHGTADGVLPLTGGEGGLSLDAITAHWSGLLTLTEHPGLGLVAGPVERRVFGVAGSAESSVDENVGLVVYRVQGQGHVWLRFKIDGQSADDWLWSFFTRRRR
ncbi:MAG: alpha/beta hydrolase family esterase [Alphaproteobacteria bacterium]